MVQNPYILLASLRAEARGNGGLALRRDTSVALAFVLLSEGMGLNG